MSSILLVTSSPRGDASISNRVALQLVDKLQQKKPGSLKWRDLAKEPVDHIGAHFASARALASDSLTTDQQRAIAVSDELIDELMAADIIVVAAGIINFGVPSTLKAWIDHIVRAGRTFTYASGAPEGLVKGKKVYLVEAYGGRYSEGPMKAANFLDAYLKFTFGFIGMTDVETIVIEGVAYGPEHAEKATAQALDRVSRLVAL